MGLGVGSMTHLSDESHRTKCASWIPPLVTSDLFYIKLIEEMVISNK